MVLGEGGAPGVLHVIDDVVLVVLLFVAAEMVGHGVGISPGALASRQRASVHGVTGRNLLRHVLRDVLQPEARIVQVVFLKPLFQVQRDIRSKIGMKLDTRKA